MTARRYQRSSVARTQAGHDERIERVEFGNPLRTFRAYIGEIDDPEANRVHYFAEDEGDNVYWTDWDPSFDPSVFDVGPPGGPYRQTNDPDEGEVLAGLRLLKRGIYSIHAIVDVFPVFNGTSLIKSNYDEGQGEFRYHNNMSPPSPNYWGDLYGIQLNHWRHVEVETDSFPSSVADFTLGGEAETCEIVLAVNTGVDFGTAATGNVDGGSPGDDVWIPGGYTGGWGLVPNLQVIYWGEGDDDPDWVLDFVDTFAV